MIVQSTAIGSLWFSDQLMNWTLPHYAGKGQWDVVNKVLEINQGDLGSNPRLVMKLIGNFDLIIN